MFLKYIFAVGSFEGARFTQDQGVLVQVCKPAKTAARGCCGVPLKTLRAQYPCQFYVSFFSHQKSPRHL